MFGSFKQETDLGSVSRETVLVIGPDPEQRRHFTQSLSHQYQVEELESVPQATQFIAKTDKNIACVLVDIDELGTRGNSFFDYAKDWQATNTIPVVTYLPFSQTADVVRALHMGAWEFIVEPYQPEVIVMRVHNAVLQSIVYRRERLADVMGYDQLTGIYNRHRFRLVCRQMISESPDLDYVMIRFDIDRFQLVNSFYGYEKGDLVLRMIAAKMRSIGLAIHQSCYGRVGGDVFAFCCSYSDKEKVRRTLEEIAESERDILPNFDLNFSFGVYYVANNNMPIHEMLDKAALASRTIKGKFNQRIAEYEPWMGKRIVDEQELTNDMIPALENHEFEVFFQPKYRLDNETPNGAEALVRWRHGKKGLVPPGKFIPVFETNGFIGQLDHYVWEETARQLRKWLDAGLNPAPISVNMSRVTLCDPHVVQDVVEQVEKYDLPVHLFQLEVTESAYTDYPEMVKQTVSGLREKGFTVLMDDFGSGYSSLSSLKDIDVDILKLDMRFFELVDQEQNRSKLIIEAVIAMAKRMGLPVVAEGVETKHQTEMLRSFGCDWVQGYYYAKPMPLQDYEKLVFGKTLDPEQK